jgi:excisionase family DNA binding protein
MERLLVTPAEAAEALDVSERTLRRLVAEGQLPAVRVRGRLRVRPADLDRYVVEHLERATPGGGAPAWVGVTLPAGARLWDTPDARRTVKVARDSRETPGPPAITDQSNADGPDTREAK